MIAQQELGLFTRSWVIWYYTFGVNCKAKFSRSHTHLLHFVMDADPARFTFNGDDPAVRVPSARQLVYADKRANPKGRLPDDTWILRPQDLPEGFLPDHDTWYFARVAGTFKERAGFHGCQMPEQLLGRIVRVSSNPGDLVLDPFAGSGTTLAVAKKLHREWLGFDISKAYVAAANARLKKIRGGQPLDGAADPVTSAPSTADGKRRDDPNRGRKKKASGRGKTSAKDPGDDRARVAATPTRATRKRTTSTGKRSADQSDMPRRSGRNGATQPRTAAGDEKTIVDAYFAVHDGLSVDRFLADPDLVAAFLEQCRNAGLAGSDVDWLHRLLGLRKTSRLPKRGPCRRVLTTHQQMDPYLFASEIAWQRLRDQHANISLDDVLCDPRRADMKEILNRKIKRRESFRPFAPSILREQTSDWFEEDDDVPFMMKVFQIREEKRAEIPAVTHVDGSGRLQTVYRHTNPRYYGLIEAFRDLTGVPMVLNTSFNENEPVVCRPEEALDCFLRTKMDVLVLGDFFITRIGNK